MTDSKDYLGIIDLLEIFGFDRSASSKLVRHRDASLDVHELDQRGWLETYQSFQANPIFDDQDFIVSFLGEEGTLARLLGIYEVGPRCAADQVPLPQGCSFEQWKDPGSVHYSLTRVSGFQAIERRVLIEWGRGTLAWHQHLTNKEVVAIRPRGEVRPPFTDYSDFMLTHRELVALVKNKEANYEWRSRLSAVAGVYLILADAPGFGRQYVGSAHGALGIWGRWESYAKSGHGGNEKLKRLIKGTPDLPDTFRYSILQVLPKTATRAEVLKWEKRFKEKLGTRATGLNLN